MAALHKDGESITKLEKADVLGRNKGVISQLSIIVTVIEQH